VAIYLKLVTNVFVKTPSDGVVANDGRYRAPPVALERQLASLKGGDRAGRNLPDGPLRLLDLAKFFRLGRWQHQRCSGFVNPSANGPALTQTSLVVIPPLGRRGG
jgi:hypothetical protein